MTSDAVDVVVIGAGPAGSLASALLAREGLSVLLVERRAFPRRKVCGGCLNAHALASLGRAGLAGRVMALGATPVERMRLYHRGRSAVVALPAGLAVSRAVLDAALAEAAAEAGCEPRFEAAAAVDAQWHDEPGGGWRHVRVRGDGGRERRVRARAIIVADGLGHSSLRDCPGFKSRARASSRVGVGGEAARGAVDTTPGAITMAVSRHGYAGAVEVEGGRVNIAAAVDPAFLKIGGPAQTVARIFEDAGVRMTPALEGVEWTGTLPLTRRLIDPAARGIFVIGDAAGYVEPFTGEGMAWALAGAEAVVPFAVRAVRSADPAAERDWVDMRARIIGRDQRWCRVLAAGLRLPALVAPAVALMSRHPAVAAPIIAHFSPRPRTAAERTP